MAASFGGISTSILTMPSAPVTKQRVDTWQVPGLDGYGAQLLGEGDSEFDVTAIVYCQASGLTSADAIAEQLIVNMELLQGTIISIVSDWGDNYENVLAIHMDPAVKQPCIYRGAMAVRVAIRWKCLTAN